jgi:hypothetical protein
MPSRSARFAVATNASRMRMRPAASISCGGNSPDFCGMADGRVGDPTAFDRAGPAGRHPMGRGSTPYGLHGRVCIANGNVRMFADCRQHRLQRGFGRVIIEAEIAGCDAADGFHGGRFDHEHGGARQGHIAEMDHVPVGGAAIFGRILAHRRNDDAIRQREVAQLEGREQGAHERFQGWEDRCHARARKLDHADIGIWMSKTQDVHARKRPQHCARRVAFDKSPSRRRAPFSGERSSLESKRRPVARRASPSRSFGAVAL